MMMIVPVRVRMKHELNKKKDRKREILKKRKRSSNFSKFPVLQALRTGYIEVNNDESSVFKPLAYEFDNYFHGNLSPVPGSSKLLSHMDEFENSICNSIATEEYSIPPDCNHNVDYYQLTSAPLINS